VARSSKPNILLCMADDWGWPHAGAYGDEGIATPSFDRIAQSGVLFHHTYVSSPSCTPSRNAVITGKYHWELGPGANLHSTLPAEHESFIHLLEDNGYVIGRSSAKSWGPGKIQSWEKVHGQHPVGPQYKTLEIFLQKTEAKTKPFFYWLATSDPHRGYKRDSGVDSGIDPAEVHLFGHYPDTDVARRDVADYYFEVQRWDTKVGLALALLEEHGLLENTIVIMTGDHGMPFPRGKGNLYDAGARVPFAVSWPQGIPAGREVQDFVSFVDIAPTLLEAAGVPALPEMSGLSFLDLLRSEHSGRLDAEHRPFAVFGRERHTPAQQAPNTGGYPSRGIRTPDFLYVRNYQPDWWPAGTPGEDGKTNLPDQWYADCDGGPMKDLIIDNRDTDGVFRRSFELCFAKRPAEELYSIAEDPDQLNNVVDAPEHAATVERLRKLLQDRLLVLDDPRATKPQTLEFDGHPYYGGGGGKRKQK